MIPRSLSAIAPATADALRASKLLRPLDQVQQVALAVREE